MTTKKIQRVELNQFYYTPIHCPFCGDQAFPGDYGDTESFQLTPCKHLLFMAHDEGFEYRSSSFNANLNITDVSSDDICDYFGDAWQGYDGLTDNVTIPDAVKFASYVSAPSFFGAYYGFSPLDENE